MGFPAHIQSHWCEWYLLLQLCILCHLNGDRHCTLAMVNQTLKDHRDIERLIIIYFSVILLQGR